MLKGALTVLCDLLPPFNSEELEKQELFCRNFLCSPGELKCVNKDSMFSRVHNVQNRKTRSGTAVHFNISLLRIPCFCWFDHAEANSIWHSNIFCLRYCFLWFNIFFKRQLHALEKTPVWNFQNFHQKHLAGWESAFYFESCSAGSKTVTCACFWDWSISSAALHARCSRFKSVYSCSYNKLSLKHFLLFFIKICLWAASYGSGHTDICTMLHKM